MSLTPRSYAVAGLLALASLGGAAEAAQAAPVDQAFVCNFPLAGLQSVDVVTDAALPDWIDPATGVPASSVTVTTKLSAAATTALGTIGAASVSGTSAAHWQLYRGANFRFVDIPLSGTPLGGASTGTIPATQISDLGSPGDPLTVSQYTITLNLSATRANGSPLVLNPIPGTTDSDGDPNTFDVLCSPDTGVSSVLFNIPTVAPTPTPVATPTPTDGPVVTPTPTKTPQPTVKPIPSLTPDPTPTPTGPAPTPTPTGGGTHVPYGYNLAGAATLKTLTKGSLPLTGKIDADLALQSGDFTADLTLAETTGNLTALGFLPVTARVDMVPTAPVSGNYNRTTQVLKATAKVRIKLPVIKALGLPLAGGTGCQASQVSTIPLTSVGAFDTLAGGTLAGSFSISNLTGCGPLNFLVTPLTAGNGNAISLKLTSAN